MFRTPITLQDIYQFFQESKPTYLPPEAAVGYVVSVLLKADSYGTELMRQFEREYPSYRLSETVLNNVIKFLDTEEWVKSYTKQCEGRGRPRRMLGLNPEVREAAQSLAQLWQGYAKPK